MLPFLTRPSARAGAVCRPQGEGRGYRRLDMGAMALVGSGLAAIEFISGNMIPITMRHFFNSRLMISLIIDLNRVFGFVVQPYVATKGDTLQTRFGRRRPFYMIGFPLTVFFMLLLGLSPHVITDEILRHSLPVLVLLFALNVFMQASQDISCGTEGPLYGDLFPQKVLGRANSLRPVAANLVQLFMMVVALKLADKNEFYPYLCSAAWAAVALLIVIVVIREKPAPPATSAQKEKYDVVKHARMLIDNKEYLKIAIVGSVGLAMPAAFGLFMSLFATETLQLSKTLFGKALSVGPYVALTLALPAGWLVDRVGSKYIIATAFFIQMFAALAIMFFVKDAFSLKIVIGLNALGGVMQGVAMLPLIFLNAPAEERGKVFGLIQFVRAAAATVVSPVIGLIADWTKGYRAGYSVCVALAVVGIIAALVTRSQRAPVRVEAGGAFD